MPALAQDLTAASVVAGQVRVRTFPGIRIQIAADPAFPFQPASRKAPGSGDRTAQASPPGAAASGPAIARRPPCSQTGPSRRRGRQRTCAQAPRAAGRRGTRPRRPAGGRSRSGPAQARVSGIPKADGRRVRAVPPLSGGTTALTKTQVGRSALGAWRLFYTGRDGRQARTRARFGFPGRNLLRGRRHAPDPSRRPYGRTPSRPTSPSAQVSPALAPSGAGLPCAARSTGRRLPQGKSPELPMRPGDGRHHARMMPERNRLPRKSFGHQRARSSLCASQCADRAVKIPSQAHFMSSA